MKTFLQTAGLKKTLVATAVATLAVGSGLAAFFDGSSDSPAIAKAAEADAPVVIYQDDCTDEATFASYTVVQGPANAPGDKWKRTAPSWGDKIPYYSYSVYQSDNAPADCYLFIPGVAFDSSKQYQISVNGFTTTGSGDNYESVLEFGYATDATADAYTCVSNAAIAFTSSYERSDYTSEAFTPKDGASYAVIRVNYEFPALAKGLIETRIYNITVTECAASSVGGDDPVEDTGKVIFSNPLATKDDLAKCVVVKGEGNPATNAEWKRGYSPYIYYNIYMSATGEADCYLFFPDVNFDADKSYTYSLDLKYDASDAVTTTALIEYGYADAPTAEAYNQTGTWSVTERDFATMTTKRFNVQPGMSYAVIRARFDRPTDITTGYMGAMAKNFIVTEFANKVQGGDDPEPVEDLGTKIFTNPFATASDFGKVTVIKGELNTSNNAWKFNKYGYNVGYTIYMTDKGEADCYMFIPGVPFKADKYYEMSVDAKTDCNKYEGAVPLEFGYADAATVEAYICGAKVDVVESEVTTVTSSRFAVAEGATYAVIRARFDKPADLTQGYMGYYITNFVVTEFNTPGEQGGEDPGDDNYEQGDALSLPFSIVPTEAQIEDIDILDNNNDYVDHGTYETGVWSYDAAKEALVYLYSDKNLTADDYVFLPLLAFDNTEIAYEISLDVMTASSRNPESFEICMGKTKEPADQKCIYKSADVVNDEDWETVKVPVGVDKKGNFYVSIHSTSTKDGFKLYVKNISVTKLETSPDVPQAPADITATAGEKGALKAEVSFTMPSLSIANRELTGDVTVTVSSSVDTKTVTAAAGETAKVEIATVQGPNNINLTAENASGKGNTAATTVYTGVDVPFAPELTAKASDDNLTLAITWEQSEIGLNGGYVDPATVDYIIYRYDSAQNDYDEGTVITGKTSYEYTCEPGTPQHRESFLITAKNVAGQQEGASTVSGVIGTPYELPMVETLPKGKLAYSPLTVAAPDASYSSSADFRAYNLATIFEQPDPNYEGIMDGHTAAIWGFIRYGQAGKCRFMFPKFSTEGVTETKVKMNVFINSIFPTVDIYATAYDAEPVKIGTISAADGEGWTPLAFCIPATFADRKWVQVYLDTEITDIDNQNVFISDYSFSAQLGSDMVLEALLGTDEALSIGDDEIFTAVVRNEGKAPAPAPAVVFSLVAENGNVVATETVTVTTTLDPEQAAEYAYTLKANADNLGAYTLVAEIADSDDNDANNEISKAVNIIRGLRPVVDDLAAEGNREASTVTLSWSKPDIKLTGLDDFEDYEPFEYGKYIGNFKNVDGDGKKTYSYDQCVFDAATLPKAFMVINPDYLNNRLVVENYAPHSGNQFLVAFCPADGSKADDWLISPEVKPSTVVSFYLSTVAPNDFSEEYEFCYSSTGNNPADFKVIAKKSVSGVKWGADAYMLPEDAKYFAIHYVSADVFGLMVDDVDFTPVINEKSTFRYNIYANDELIDSDIDKTSYTLNDVKDFSGHYNVTAVVDGKEYAPSNTAVVRVVSGLLDADAAARSIKAEGCTVTVTGYEGEAVAVYAVDGTTLFSTTCAADVTTVNLNAGVYIVKAGNDVKKIALK